MGDHKYSNMNKRTPLTGVFLSFILIPMKPILYIMLGIALGMTGSVFAGTITLDGKIIDPAKIEIKAIKTFEEVKIEKENMDMLASKYAQLYDSCKNK